MSRNGPVKFVIHDMIKQIEEMEVLLEKYPNLHVEETWDEERYFTQDVNKIVDSFEAVGSEGFEFYLTDNKNKIYADPPAVNTFTDEGYEIDWLDEIVLDEINPKVLVALMRKINSHYIFNKYYHTKMPYLLDWFEKY